MMLPLIQCLSATRLNTNVAFDMMELWMKGFNQSMAMVTRSQRKERWISNMYRTRQRPQRLTGCCTAALFWKEGVIMSELRPANHILCEGAGSYQH